ncbi:MAG: 16S rRNA (adenine(1518)-N(6)/adenine(1519)-N(6))-dimethyltransferase RsmA [Candidatus Hydrogenedentes bacterium]|nr:16S rRNA (adenine(1518)-N(6)/adenine(1519)-N(6))-dimethyltransferase RsmA [Candidatus Hydrogenedentota bacterium]
MALKDLVQQHGIRFKKRLGQNLLLDENINRILVEAAALTPEDDVVEVGAGLGALTERLRHSARRVFAVEIDRAFMPVLEDRFGGIENVVLFRGDILNHALDKLVDEFLPGARTLKMVSNLPYYITTPILFHFWESSLSFERMLIMVQEEVGLRMVAPVGARDYGKFTLAAQYYAEIDIVRKVPRTCFTPQPKVDSVIVRIRNRKDLLYPGIDTRFLLGLIGAAFSKRRKTLRNSLIKNTTLGIPQEKMAAAFQAIGIDPSRRPQTLTLDDFAAIAGQLQPPG